MNEYDNIQILREINFGDSECVTYADFAILKALEVWIWGFDFLHFLKADIYQIYHFQSP